MIKLIIKLHIVYVTYSSDDSYIIFVVLFMYKNNVCKNISDNFKIYLSEPLYLIYNKIPIPTCVCIIEVIVLIGLGNKSSFFQV